MSSPPASSDPRDRVRAHFDRQAPRQARQFQRGFTGWLARRDEAALLELVDAPPGTTLLDVGCGSGHHARLLVERGLRVSVVDLSPEMVALARPHVDDAQVASLETLALGRTFERVICLGVLDYAEDLALCFGRLVAHLAPGGRLVVAVPRRGIGGACYGTVYRWLNGVTPRLYATKELNAVAARSGLAPHGERRTFLHCMHLAWALPATATRAERG